MTTENKPTASLSAGELDKLEALLNAATPGEWEANRQTDDECNFIGYFIEAGPKAISDDGTAPGSADALFIVAAKNSMGALIAQARAALPLSSTSIESLSRASGEERGQQAPEASVEDARDAARWRAFVGSARIKPQGSAGLESDTDPYGNPYNGYAHMGLEIWTRYSRDFNAEILETMDKSTKIGRDWLTKYADVAIDAAMSATQEGK